MIGTGTLEVVAIVVALGAIFTHAGRVALWWLVAGILWHLPRWVFARLVRHEEACDRGHRHDKTFSPEQAAVIRRRAGGQCERHDPHTGERCGAFHGAPGVTCENDHVVARKHRGPTIVDNAQLLCGPCNRSKSGRLVDRDELRALARHRRAYWPRGVRIPHPERYLP